MSCIRLLSTILHLEPPPPTKTDFHTPPAHLHLQGSIHFTTYSTKANIYFEPTAVVVAYKPIEKHKNDR